jgi:hypothetical protein
MATVNQKLSKDTRIKIGKSADATADTDFVLIENEQEATITRTADVQTSTIKAGTYKAPGEESWEIQFTTAENLDDVARSYMRKAFNKRWPFRVYDQEDLWISGDFILSSAEIGAPAVGARTGSYTIQNAGPVTEVDLDEAAGS